MVLEKGDGNARIWKKVVLFARKIVSLLWGLICKKFYILLQPCYDMNLANKTSFYLLHLFDGNAPNLHFFLFFFKLSKHLLHIEMETWEMILGLHPFRLNYYEVNAEETFLFRTITYKPQEYLLSITLPLPSPCNYISSTTPAFIPFF